MNETPLIFDGALVRQHIARAKKNFAQHSALFDDCAEQIKERLSEVKREFPQTLDLSPFPFLGKPAAPSEPSDSLPLEGRVREGGAQHETPSGTSPPIPPQSLNLIVSNLVLHWVNDVPGALTQIRTALKPEGLFIASLIGGQSLQELRACLLEAELAITGGVSPRLSPMIDLQTASQLMQRAGFKLPVADKETVTLIYPDMFALMRDLRGMGQTNAHTQRLRHPTRRAVFFEAAKLYYERFGNAHGHIPATFEIIYLHGWG